MMLLVTSPIPLFSIIATGEASTVCPDTRPVEYKSFHEQKGECYDTPIESFTLIWKELDIFITYPQKSTDKNELTKH